MLTTRERETLEFLRQYISMYHVSPTIKEIANALGIKSKGVAYRYIEKLRQQGYVHINNKRHRGIELADSAINDSLPIIGQIAAGEPVEAIEEPEHIDLTARFCHTSNFALKVKGNSMIDEGIMDGDIVVCRQVDQLNDGDIVVALIDGTETTLKYLERHDDKITLKPAHSDMEPLTYNADRVQIQGKFVGLLRLSSL